jgi:hypothetical protein
MPRGHLEDLIYWKPAVDQIIQPCAGDKSLYVMDALQKMILPAAVQFRENIIQ